MKTPAFQFYPQDFISSLDVQVMTVEQVGAYWLLLSNAWIHEPQGYLPNNDLLLQRICRMNDKQWSKNKSLILKKFEKEGEFIFNARLLKEIEKQGEYRKKQAQNGAKGGRPKANDNPEKPTALSGLTQHEPKKSSSFSTSSSSSISSSEEDKSSSGSGEPKKTDNIPQEFLQAHKAYYSGKKRSVNDEFEHLKKSCKNWKEVIKILPDAVEAFKKDMDGQKVEPRYIKMMQGWITDKRWGAYIDEAGNLTAGIEPNKETSKYPPGAFQSGPLAGMVM